VQKEVGQRFGRPAIIEDRKRAEALLAAEKRTLEMIAGGARLADILENLCDTIDAQAGNIISAVMLMDTDGVRLWPVAAPRLLRVGLRRSVRCRLALAWVRAALLHL
jgi:hypothetical protein